MSAKRISGEALDAWLNHFELLRDEAQERRNVVVLNVRGYTQKLLMASGYPHKDWHQLFQDFEGRMPETEDQYAQLLAK